MAGSFTPPDGRGGILNAWSPRSWLAMSVGFVLLVSALDLLLGPRLILIVLLAAGPLLAAARTSLRQTVLVASLAFVGAVALGVPDGIFLQAPHLVRVVAVALAGVLAIGASRVRLAAESDLRALAMAVGTAHEAVVQVGADGLVRGWNAGAERLFGIPASTAVGRSLAVLAGAKDVAEAVGRVLAGAPSAFFDTAVVRPEGERIAAVSIYPVHVAVSEPEGAVVIARDITERRLLDLELRQAQKLESVGRLAGGVAHDFNNLLTVILGAASEARAHIAPDSAAQGELHEIVRAAERAADITRQLLTFARRQPKHADLLDVSATVTGLRGMLERLLGPRIDLQFSCPALDGRVRADRTQLEQIVLNLALNARDAMPDGGRLTIETAQVELDAQYAAGHPEVEPGRYLMIAVGDTGHGMDAATRDRVFEPFFTTKPTGKGTGLGLATTYGIVSEGRGHIWLYSEPGHGTIWKVYLPRVEADDAPAETVVPVEIPTGTETILLVDDDETVRRLTERLLVRLGYRVLPFSGDAALEGAAAYPGRIDLVIADLMMPGLGGRELVRRLRFRYPDLPVVFMSGYAPHAAQVNGHRDRDEPFLAKPFHVDALAQTVRAALGAVRDGPVGDG